MCNIYYYTTTFSYRGIIHTYEEVYYIWIEKTYEKRWNEVNFQILNFSFPSLLSSLLLLLLLLCHNCYSYSFYYIFLKWNNFLYFIFFLPTELWLIFCLTLSFLITNMICFGFWLFLCFIFYKSFVFGNNKRK